jgi:hypothetical protein
VRRLTIELFSASKVLALIAGVNGAIAGTLVFKGGYDAATNTPDLDVVLLEQFNKVGRM